MVQRLGVRMLVVSLALPLPAELAGGFTVFPFSLVATVLAALWALEVSQRPAVQRRQLTRVDPVLVAGFAMLIAVGLSNVVTGAQWQYWSLWVWLILLYSLARYRVPGLLDVGDLSRLLLGIVLGLVGLGLVQVVTARPIGALAQYFDHTVRAAVVYEALGSGAIFKRVQGTFFSVDLFAMFIAYVFFASFALLVGSRRTARASAGTAALALFCVAFTFSRGVWIAVALCTGTLVVVFVAQGLLSPGRLVKASLVASAAVGVLFVVAPDAVFARFESGQVEQSVTVRQDALNVGYSVIEARPWFGVGYLQFVDASNALGLNTVGNEIRPHNVYVQLWAEQGVFVLAAFLALGGAIVGEARRAWRGAEPARRALAGGVIASVAALAIFGLVYAQAAEYSGLPMLFASSGYLIASATRRSPSEDRAHDLVGSSAP